MSEDKKVLEQLLKDLQELFDQNENPDGSFRFDYFRAKVALEFAKAEITKTISEE